MWLQRSRIAWLKEGDRNTSYFHRQAARRARKNRIKKLKDSNGEWCENSKQMQFFQRSAYEIFYNGWESNLVPLGTFIFSILS